MQARVVRREKTGLAGQALCLHLSAVARQNSGADRTAIAFCSFQAHFDPMIAGGSVIAQKRRGLIAVHDENVEVAIVVEVAEGASAAHVARCNGGTGLIAQFEESSIALVAEYQTRIAGGILGVDFFRSEEHTSELQSLRHLVCRLLL